MTSPPSPKVPRLDGPADDTPRETVTTSESEPRRIVGLIDTPACRIMYAHTDVYREFMHIVLRSNATDNLCSSGAKSKKPIITCDTYEGPFQTKWSLHFYPEGHPSNYSFHPDVEWFPAQYVPDDQKFASLYVRLKDGPYEMIEARMMTSVLSGESDIDAALATNMERFMLCPRMKVDEFHREAAGHGWPKLCLTNNLKSFPGGFICVVSLQVLQPMSGGSLTGLRRLPIPIHRHTDVDSKQLPFIVDVRQNGAFSDAILQSTDWRHIGVHRFVLATKSGFFRRKLCEDQGVPFVYKTEHTFDELAVLVDMIYLDKLPKRNGDLTVTLLAMAAFYELPLLKRVLVEELQTMLESREAKAISSDECLDLSVASSSSKIQTE